jgi:hypothetical protein
MSEATRTPWPNRVVWPLIVAVVGGAVGPLLTLLLTKGCQDNSPVVGPPSSSPSTQSTRDYSSSARQGTQRDVISASTPPLTPEEAAKRVDEECTVEMRVAHTHITDYYLMLDSKRYKEAGNFIIRIKKSVLPEIKEIGAGDPERYFFGKTIIVSGTVTRYEEQGVITVINQDQLKKIRK